ncbi:HNH endonuclease [Clostridium bornimense]|uniref:HNH endonuclease n=1 Tax=Clostridium bornimense TaxID=1216932 RepID=UPI001C103A97|nr:HNH endonuclease [Clostridium bornimense]MBU5317735.1 HNH endonuclease [Clostridium bornimense]
MASKNKFSIHGDDIYITRPEWDKLCYATYREDYYDEITRVTWTKNNNHIKSSKLGYLHRYIIEKWYPDVDIDKLYKNGWIIEHMDNNGFNCRISNLEFLPKRYNTAKGQTVDIDRKRLMTKIALSMYKDFSTGCYQITIFFNSKVEEYITGRQIQTLKLLYKPNTDYKMVIHEAEEILFDFENNKAIDMKKLRFDDYKIGYSTLIKVNPEEKNRPIIERNGELYINLSVPGSGIVSLGFDTGWTPRNK